MSKERSFLDIHKNAMNHGFWEETNKAKLFYSMELLYNSEVLKEWCITDVLINGNKTLIKWDKRMFQLSDEEVKEKYGR